MYYPTRNQQPAIGNVVISPSPLSSPRWVEEIFFQSAISNQQSSY